MHSAHRRRDSRPSETSVIVSSNENNGRSEIATRLNGIRVLFESRSMLLAQPIFFIGVFRGISLRVLLQYTSVRFGWKLSQVCDPHQSMISY